MLNAQDLPQGSASNELERNNFDNLRGNNNVGRNFGQVSTVFGFSQQPTYYLSDKKKKTAIECQFFFKNI